ncbi:helix-turn-helix transcriptional regulator [Amycolatopsis suaedae]|uniref:YafY family transcriptional regulator n=1 Tax=Amycolatopsis suaedae TaxID=2510978 RepID=A0A4Q7J0Z2_9PSEU|nr:YafY family protein [Amycolatopsis suaedae]RZQ60076.1 YafY family transcriptional regulator [Amycolatopsis suaedae]
MLETSARLLRLLSLLQIPRVWTGAELAERLEVGPRTVRRDIDKLRNLGYPVEATSGVPGYRLGRGADLPPLLLDDDEAVAVAVGLRAAAAGTVAGVAESSVSALAKLERLLPSRLRHRVGLFQQVAVLPAGGPEVDPDTLTAVAAACRDHQRLRFDYRGHDGTETVRHTEPHRLVHTGRRWYLVAWDVDREDWRTFRVDRLSPRVPTGPRFTPREPPAEAGRYTARSVSVSAYRHRARFVIEAPAPVVADRISATVGVVEPLDDHRCALDTGANSLDELVLYVALLGHRFTVTGPPEVVAHVRELTARLAAATPADSR